MVAKKEISLLPDSENVNSVSSRALRWVSTVGRFIIVFTELIVVVAFISRFWLDRKNADLSEVVRQQRAILESTSEFETQFKVIQKKLISIKTFYQNTPKYDEKIQTLVESAPPDISFNSISISQDEKTKKITASAVTQAFRESSIVDFLTNLTVNKNISSITINNIEKKPRENKYDISLSLSYIDDKVVASPATSSSIKK